MIKKRKAKNSKRGIYIQDTQLKETLFSPGTNYKYLIGDGEITIVPSTDKNDNKVSKRKLKDGLKPVIDIRNKKALKVFESCDYLQVSIYKDKVIVEGFQQIEEKDKIINVEKDTVFLLDLLIR